MVQHHPSPIVDTVDCDFLIVGAGSSGCVLASRLVRAGLKVLLVEKGPADGSTLSKLVQRPSGWVRECSSGKGLSEAFMTVPQAGLNNRIIPAYRGRGGGGTSNINAVLYQRGREEDYEEHWPWELKDIEASFKSVESELTLEQLKPTRMISPTFDRMLEETGFARPSLPPSAAEGNTTAATTTSDDDSNIEAYTEPTWTKEGLGGCPMKRTTTKGGERQSAWAAFVTPVTTMPNLKVKDDALVSRVIIEGGRAVGVEIVESSPRRWWGGGGGTRVRQLRLAKKQAEIFLCCGAFRSPKLLMLSGVGPREHLEEKGVAVVADNPHVGENLQDHVVVVNLSFSKPHITDADHIDGSIHGIVYFSRTLPALSSNLLVAPGCSSVSAGANEGTTSLLDDTIPPSTATTTTAAPSSTSSSSSSTPTSPAKAVLGYMNTDSCFIANNIGPNACFLVTRPGLSGNILRAVVLAVCWIAGWVTPVCRMLRGGTRGVSMLVTTIKSRGTVRLASGTDISAPPVIDPRYLSHPDDQRALCECWRTLRRAKRETAAGKAIFGSDVLPGITYNNGDDDKSFLKFARDNCLSYFHPVGTCRMGRGKEDSVVSANDLRVHGVSGLRVADASVAPHIPATATQAMCMMIGDRAAAITLKDRFAKDQVQARLLEAASSSAN